MHVSWPAEIPGLRHPEDRTEGAKVFRLAAQGSVAGATTGHIVDTGN